jgi:hypothetical protein
MGTGDATRAHRLRREQRPPHLQTVGDAVVSSGSQALSSAPMLCELSQQVEDLALASRDSSLNIAKISVSVALMPLLL